MSVLTDPVKPGNRGAVRSADEITTGIRALSRRIRADWERGFDLVWNNPVATPEEVLRELGTSAKEVFDLSAATFVFMESIMEGPLSGELERLRGKLAARKPYTVHGDGTITIDDA